MKVKQNRHGQTLQRAACVRAACYASAAMLIVLLPALAQAQSAGMAQLLRPSQPGHASGGAPTPAVPGKPGGGERLDQREARTRAEKYRTERDMAERAGRQGPPGGHPKLSPDERKTLRKNLHDLGREMYDGG